MNDDDDEDLHNQGIQSSEEFVDEAIPQCEAAKATLLAYKQRENNGEGPATKNDDNQPKGNGE